jgi:hypothetical protein
MRADKWNSKPRQRERRPSYLAKMKRSGLRRISPSCRIYLQRILNANALAPLCRSSAFRKYDSTCLAVVSAQL